MLVKYHNDIGNLSSHSLQFLLIENRQSDCRKGPATDKPNFTKLIRELRQEFKKYDLLLGVAISGYKEVITEAYEMSRLSDYADFLTVMTYGKCETHPITEW